MDTSRLADMVHGIAARGLGLRRSYLAVSGPFPVAGPANWSNDWHVRRCEPYPHLHEGIDIFAPHGSPVVAIADGRISQREIGSISGLSVEITDAQGIQYFYAHLSAFRPGLVPGGTVQRGQVLGYIGTTGNAQGTSPHLHLEVQPGGVPVPPKPYVDRWLRSAEHRAEDRLERLRGRSQKRSQQSSEDGARRRAGISDDPTLTSLGTSVPGQPLANGSVAWAYLVRPLLLGGALAGPAVAVTRSSGRRRPRRRWRRPPAWLGPERPPDHPGRFI
jgi:murein DD-endopeptidase MepM/ murein hydrolase activator NlpD